MTNMFSLKDIDVVVAEIDLERVRTVRASNKSFGE